MIPEAREVDVSRNRKVLEARCRSPVTLQRDLKRARIVLLAIYTRATDKRILRLLDKPSPVTRALAQVGDKWAVCGNAGPPLRFVDRKTGHAVKLAMVDKETGQPVRAEDVRPQEGPGADELVRWRLTHVRK